jgi:hypothetical protein
MLTCAAPAGICCSSSAVSALSLLLLLCSQTTAAAFLAHCCCAMLGRAACIFVCIFEWLQWVSSVFTVRQAHEQCVHDLWMLSFNRTRTQLETSSLRTFRYSC